MIVELPSQKYTKPITSMSVKATLTRTRKQQRKSARRRSVMTMTARKASPMLRPSSCQITSSVSHLVYACT